MKIEDRRSSDNFFAVRLASVALALQGHSWASWAQSKGYQPRTVTQVAYRYAGTQDQPRGRLSWKILCDLSRDTGIELVPGSLKEAA